MPYSKAFSAASNDRQTEGREVSSGNRGGEWMSDTGKDSDVYTGPLRRYTTNLMIRNGCKNSRMLRYLEPSRSWLQLRWKLRFIELSVSGVVLEPGAHSARVHMDMMSSITKLDET
jgi:hypothetical protein